jgi:hypothetical protein
VFHVAARSLATQGLSIFGDHSDVMSVRMTGFAMLAAASVQEAHDLALVAQAATLESRVPVMYFFDGFRTSHEENKISVIPDTQIREMIDDDLVRAFRARALSPEHPVVRGTAHNPDTFFQARKPSIRSTESAGHRPEGDGPGRRSDGTTLSTLPLHGTSERRTRGGRDRFRLRSADETAAYLNDKGEKVGVPWLSSTLVHRRFHGCDAPIGEGRCDTRSDQGAGALGEPST